MNNINHQFPIAKDRKEVFKAISTPEGINMWWSRESSISDDGKIIHLSFGPGYNWDFEITDLIQDSFIELKPILADSDWEQTTLSLRLEEKDGSTTVYFNHENWPLENDHFRISSFCWAMYLRLLKKYIEEGTVVPYSQRLED